MTLTLTLTLALAVAVLAGLEAGGGGAANAQSPQMVISGTAISGKPGAGPMSKAVFNHQKHEGAVAACETCHHASMDACSSCHTSQGGAEGGNVQLSRAMHESRSQMSCVGCHQKEAAKKNCVGCHRSIPAGPNAASCTVCHRDPKAAPAPAAKMAQPDTVVIGSIAKKYDACTFNHASHVDTLMEATKKSSLAQAFHAKPGVLCAGCHHHTPADQAPPKCGTCHSKAFQDEDPKRPGLMAAYHIQCNQCHKAMGVESPKATDCETCHTAKK